jgi:hypothetical protein
MSASQRRGRRIRCFGHVTNLGAQVFIKKASKGGLDDIDRSIKAKDHHRLE